MQQEKPDVSELWIQQLRRSNKTTLAWACKYCPDRQIFATEDNLWKHAQSAHPEQLPSKEEGEGEEALERFRKSFEAECAQKRTNKDNRPPVLNEANSKGPEPPPTHAKRPLSTPAPFPPARTLSAIGALNLGTPRGNDDVTMQDVSEDDRQTPDQPRKRAAIGDGISAGSASPFREQSDSPPPRRSKARPTSAPYPSASEENIRHDTFESPRPNVGRKTLWTPDQEAPLSRTSFDPSNIASIQAQKSRAQAHRLQTKPGKSFQTHNMAPRNQQHQNPHSQPPPGILPRPQSAQSAPSTIQRLHPKGDTYDIILQPETRPISQEQLVAEVKGIYAGLVMVEAKCIEVDNKQATLGQADPGAQPKLNNEQWQALIALHRTLLHEHHDFFLASQHPSASPALRRLASKYAMPARMWRHGIHSFLELLRHRLPASLDHMLAFIYLAYSMMALLYETVPAFEDTWIECLGDLARYRMAIEDDDIRDREVWTGVARHWYSKASNDEPKTGRLYHHLAILARPNALQQLFYYSKSLCVEIPFGSARESILTLFDPVLNAKGSNQYRLPPLDTAFVKAHGMLFTGKYMDKFEATVNDFLGLLDNQIGRVTRKFMEQGYQIAIANNVAMLEFASKSSPLMQAIEDDKWQGEGRTDVDMTTSREVSSQATFKLAEQLSNKTLAIVLQRYGDPNVLPFIHVTLVYVSYVAAHPSALSLVRDDFPWKALSTYLNTLLGVYKTRDRIEDDKFPLPEKDQVRPFPEDYAMRGLIFTDKYFPDEWFKNENIDEEDKYREAASMTEQRKERILWLSCMIAKLCPWLIYTGEKFTVPSPKGEDEPEISPLESRSLTAASATTVGSLDRATTWATLDSNPANQSEAEEDLPSITVPAAEHPSND